MKIQQGFSLIELVVFIVVIGIALSAIFSAFQSSLNQTPAANAQTNATQLAQARMEIILGQRRLVGFNNFNDPCTSVSPPAICTVPAALSGYSITSSITATSISGNSNYKIITVTATGPQQSRANLTTLVGSIMS